MKKILKILVWILLSLVVIAGLAFAAVTIFINPNNIKPYLTKMVAEQSGQELAIEGELKWTLYPLLGVSAEHVILKNKPNFPNEPLINAKKIIVSVQLRPLFSKQIKIDEILMSDVDINLTKNNASENNWTLEKSKSAKNEETETATAQKYSVDISKILIQNANIKYNNIPEHKITSLTKLNFSTKNMQLEKPFKLNADFNYDNSHYIFAGNVEFHSEDELLVLRDYRLTIQGKKDTKISGDAELNFKSEQLVLKPFHIQLPSFKAVGNIQGSKVFSTPNIIGHLDTENFNLKNVATSLGYPIHTASSDALSSALISMDLTIIPNVIQLDNIRGTIDQTKFTGSLRWNMVNSLLNFTIIGNQISLNKYKMASESTKTADQGAKNQSNSNFKANGKLSFGTIIADKIQFDRFSSNLSYEDEVLNLTNIVAGIFGGTTTGSASISTKTKEPVIQINQNLSGINISAAEKLLIGESKISGTANVQANLRVQGEVNNLNGNINFVSRNGEIQGVDLDYQLQRAASLIQRSDNAAKDRGKTPYSTLSSVATIKNGVVYNSQVLLESPTFKVSADGATNLVSKAIDYNLKLKSKKSIDINTEILHMDLSDYEIPVTITGTFDEFNVKLNVVELSKAAAKKQLIKQIEKAAERPLGDTIESIRKALPF